MSAVRYAPTPARNRTNGPWMRAQLVGLETDAKIWPELWPRLRVVDAVALIAKGEDYRRA